MCHTKITKKGTHHALKMLVKHIEKLKQNECYSHAMFIVVIEGNQPVLVDDLYYAVVNKGIPNVQFLKEMKGLGKEKSRPGFVTTAYSKERMVNIMRDQLRLKKICFAEEFICAEPHPIMHDLKQEFESQMRKFSKKKIVTRDHKNDIDVVHYTYSGKVIRENDDFVMASMFSGYGRELFFAPQNRSKYAKYW